MKIKLQSFLLPLFVVTSFSLLTLISINYQLFQSQLIKLCFAFAILFLVSKIPNRLFEISAKFVYIGALGLLAINLLHFSQIKRWVNVFGFFVQFSEFAKIALILTLAKFLSANKMNIRTFCYASILVLIPTIMIFKQPNLGTAIIFASIGFGMIWFKGINTKAIVAFAVSIFSCLPFIWMRMLPYQKSRILAFINPTADPRGSSYQTIQSMIAIGAGGILGSDALQNKLGFVPENHTDFLFSCFCEQYGFIMAAILLSSIFFGMHKLLSYTQYKDEFTNFFIVGFVLMWFVEVTMNVGMNIGILPVTGIALPGFSFGGSSLVAFFIGYGIILNLIKNRIR